MTPFAHSGHWLVQLLYAVPVLGFLGALAWAHFKEKRGTGLSDRDGRD